MGRKDKNIKPLSWSRALLRVLMLYAIGIVVVAGILFYYSTKLPTIEELQRFEPELTTRIFSRNGVVLDEISAQRRTLIPLEKIPPEMIQAAIAIEDARFRQHWGVSLRDFFRAVVIDILTLSKAQGASTLTQQLARILYEKIGYEKTISRKIKEFLTALQLERMYTKDEIAGMYVNSSYMGHTYGIQAAAEYYLNKSAENLTLDECALLAGVIKHSVRFSPIRNPVNAFQRRNLVLSRMMEMNFISEEEYELYKNRPLQIQRSKPAPAIAPYFVEYIKRQIRREDESLDINIYKDGLSIYTTLDTRIQTIADTAFHGHLQKQQQVLNRRLLNDPKKLQSIISDTTVSLEQVQAMIKGELPLKESLRKSLVVQGALAAIDFHSGHILAMIGGRDFKESQWNRTTQAKRQPGSAFKPIVYATAVDNGFPVTTQLLNQPVVLNMGDGTRWAPENYDHSTGGLTTLREGLRRSLNLIAARIVQELISPESVVKTARRMHLSTHIPAVDAIALGSASVKPIELTSAYGIFANQGVWVEPIAITKIVDRYGNVIAEYSPRRDMVFSEETAYITTDLLQTVINEGTGGSARWKFNFRRTAAGKTGTTNNFSDAWFVGFTPHLVAGVYVGVDDPSVSLGENESGNRAALPIWARFMRNVHRTLEWPYKKFTRPPGVVDVEICSETKLLPSKYCPLETEIFNRQNVPTEHCPVHREIERQKNKDKVIF